MAKRKAKVKGYDWCEQSVFEALEWAYPDRDRFVLVPQIPDATSFSKCRTIDAMLFHCWRSDGIAVHAFEIKVARGDMLREIQNPDKSHGFMQRCHYFWIAAPAGVCKLEELPAAWGLREVFKTEDGFSSKIRRSATYNPNPDFDVTFIVALARACYRKSPDRIANQAEIDAAYERGRQHEKIDRSAEKPWAERRYLQEYEQLKDNVAKFEAASGIRISDAWDDPGDIGKQLQLFRLLGDPQKIYGEVARRIESLLKEAKAMAAPPGPTDLSRIQRRRDERARQGVGLDDCDNLDGFEQGSDDIKPLTDDEINLEISKMM